MLLFILPLMFLFFFRSPTEMDCQLSLSYHSILIKQLNKVFFNLKKKTKTTWCYFISLFVIVVTVV